MQLVAYGAQDVYLTGNPQITFWKVTYRRHTNFAMESIEQTFNGQADFGRRVTCTISRNGDLAYRTYLQVTLPEINQSMKGVGDAGVWARWLDFPGEQMISQVELEIGGQRIDRQYGDWMHIWNQLTLSAEQQRGYYKMVGNTTQLTFICDPSFAAVDGPCASGAPVQVCEPRNALPETTLYIPFLFWYCRNPGLALPLIALQYHEVKINLDIRPIDECLWAVNTLDCTPGTKQSVKSVTPYNQSLVAASLYVDYVFLDTDERRRMAQNPHEYLIEQLQFTGDESVGSSSNKIKLNLNHPCKELIWVVQPDANVDYCASLNCNTMLYKTLGAQPFNYTDGIDALPNAIHAFGGAASIAQTTGSYIDASGLFNDAGAVDVTAASWWNYDGAGGHGSGAGGFDNGLGASGSGGVNNGGTAPSALFEASIGGGLGAGGAGNPPSAAGSGGAAGIGVGGLLILIVRGSVTINGTLSSNGSAGNSGYQTQPFNGGGGGGGSGGGRIMIIYGNTFTNAGTIVINGGNGGAGAPNGISGNPAGAGGAGSTTVKKVHV